MIYNFESISEFFNDCIHDFLLQYLEVDVDNFYFEINENFVEILVPKDNLEMNIKLTNQDDLVHIEFSYSNFLQFVNKQIILDKNDELFTSAILVLIVSKSYAKCEYFDNLIKKAKK